MTCCHSCCSPSTSAGLFDAVSTDEEGNVRRILVKQRAFETKWIWGAFKMPGAVFHQLHAVWLRPERCDEYFGTLVNQ